MSTVRPLAKVEEYHAWGQPLATYSALFGLTQGMLTHLKLYKVVPASGNWFPTQQSKFVGLLLMGGGLAAGHLIGKHLFGSPALQRLAH